MHVATNKQLVALEIKQLVAIVITETTTTSMAMAACSAGRALARAPVDDPCPRGPGLSRPIDVNRGSSSIAKASAAARRLGHVIAVGLEHDPASLAPSSNKSLPPPSSPPPPQQQPCPRRSSCFTPLRLLVGGFCLRHPAASPLSRAPPPPCGRDTASASCAPPSSPTVPPLLALALEATPRQTQPTTDCPRTGGLFSSNTSKMSSQSLWSSS